MFVKGQGLFFMDTPDSHRETWTTPELSDRIRQLCETIWGGNKTRMARELGVSQAAMWRVLQGKQPPLGKLLENLARHSRVDLHWLFRGEEKSDNTTDINTAACAIAHVLPVARKLLSGLPSEHSDLFQSDFPVAGPMYRATRCWYEVSRNAGILRNAEARLSPQDLLLFEYDLGQFPSLLDMDRHIAVAWVTPYSPRPERQERRLEVGVIEYDSDPENARLDLVVGEPDYYRWKDVKSVPASIVAFDKVADRRVKLRTTTEPAYVDSSGNITPISSHARMAVTHKIAAQSDIVAVCVGIFRRDGFVIP